jgi:phosphoribosylformimino-5-aminoimidazole carboxamide ribotide isomerase
MTGFRPCIDLHSGQVKQIVGGTLDTDSLKTNFVSVYAHPSSGAEQRREWPRHPPSYYVELYKKANLRGGHVIKLGPGNDEAAKGALRTWPGILLTCIEVLSCQDINPNVFGAK